jgi:hypothetical protein
MSKLFNNHFQFLGIVSERERERVNGTRRVWDLVNFYFSASLTAFFILSKGRKILNF